MLISSYTTDIFIFNELSKVDMSCITVSVGGKTKARKKTAITVKLQTSHTK